MQNEKSPIVIGVTGHRNIVEEDKDEIKARVIDGLKEVQGSANGAPVVMLNGFAQGADMLCAEAAFELGIDVIAVLPCEAERYIKSFDNETDEDKLNKYLAKAKRSFIAPDIEKNKQWLQKNYNIDSESYEYRQQGIYIAQHSHVLLALWDGKPPKTEYGCGTAEVVEFALKRNFSGSDVSAELPAVNKTAVLWIKTRRQDDCEPADIQKSWIV